VDGGKARGIGLAPWLRAHAAELALFALAWALRLVPLGSDPYGDEAAHYYVARHFGAAPANITPPEDIAYLFWQRPLFSLLLGPGAQVSFAAYRILHAAVAALLPVLVAGLLGRLGVRRPLACGAGLAVAVTPTFVLWGSRAFPDSLMAALALAGIWAYVAGRPLGAALLLLGASWVKETAIPLAVLLWVVALWRGHRRGEAGIYPLRLDRQATAMLAAVALAPLPLVVSVGLLGGRPPGWSTSAMGWPQLDGFFLSSWLLLPVLAGLLWPRTRRWSLLALAYPLGYTAYQALLHRGIEGWYLVLPQALVLVSCALVAEEVLRRLGPARRRTAWAAPVAMALLLLALVALPHGAAKQWTAPASPSSTESLPAMLERTASAHDQQDAVRALGPRPWEGLFVVDAGWFFILHPFSEGAARLGWAYSETAHDLAPWVKAIEQDATRVVVERHDLPLNQAIRDTYRDCTVAQNPTYTVLEGRRCAGRSDALRASFVAHGGRLDV
jgi:hypothetical protein